MTTRMEVVDELGEIGQLMPELINRGLTANDRLKYYLTLLQAARSQAQQPHQSVSNLHFEREASGVGDAELDDVVAGSSLQPGGLLTIPRVRRIRDLLVHDLHEILRPLQVADRAGDLKAPVDEYARRLELLTARIPAWDDDQVAPGDIDALTRVAEAGRDSVHQFVMDLHRELNRLQGSVARESIDGALTYGLNDGDRALVRAFMKGVNETAPLKFDHPGLGTTATRTGERLSIQNDLGTTDAHLIVITLVGSTGTIVYTDIHRRRALFCRELLEPCGVTWQAAPPPAGAAYELSVGRFAGADEEALERALTFIGSRLVFLIDWNKARKRLARFVRRSDAVAALRWAADNNVGHRAFLQAGDMRLIYTALERAARAQIRYGARLDELLGRDAARAFLTSVLRITAEGLKSGRSLRLIQDEIEAELLTHLQTTERSTLEMAAEHAALVAGLAERLRDALVRLKSGRTPDHAARTAELAKAWEARADDLVSRARRLRDQSAGTHILTRLLAEADNIADALEEAAFLLTLLPSSADRKGIAELAGLADLIGASTREYVRCLECAKDLPREPARSDVEDVLVAVDRLMELEHHSDAAERAVKARLLGEAADYRQLYVLSAIAHGFEQAAGALARCSLLVRDYVLSGVAVRV